MGLAILLSQTSCSTPRFKKFGASDLDWERDKGECSRGASGSYYERCLELRGWKKQP